MCVVGRPPRLCVWTPAAREEHRRMRKEEGHKTKWIIYYSKTRQWTIWCGFVLLCSFILRTVCMRRDVKKYLCMCIHFPCIEFVLRKKVSMYSKQLSVSTVHVMLYKLWSPLRHVRHSGSKSPSSSGGWAVVPCSEALSSPQRPMVQVWPVVLCMPSFFHLRAVLTIKPRKGSRK